MALICEMLAPPVVLVAGSRPEGQPPAKDELSSTVSSPPRWGGPAGCAVPPAVPPPPPQAASTSSTARRRDRRCALGLTWTSRFVASFGAACLVVVGAGRPPPPVGVRRGGCVEVPDRSDGAHCIRHSVRRGPDLV